MTAPRRHGTVLVWLAGVVGAVHAASSLSWALGSTWLLDTVGDGAPEAIARTGIPVGLALGAVAAVKLVAAVVPILVAHDRLPWRRLWRTVSWIGGIGLVLYGAVNAAVAGLVLLGVIRPHGGFDRAAMLGHALLWDPLFAVWGALLVASLRRSRRAPRS